jgi:hypothetical protein
MTELFKDSFSKEAAKQLSRDQKRAKKKEVKRLKDLDKNIFPEETNYSRAWKVNKEKKQERHCLIK